MFTKVTLNRSFLHLQRRSAVVGSLLSTQRHLREVVDLSLLEEEDPLLLLG